MGGDKASMVDAMNNPFMDNASLGLVADAWKRANQPPAPPELKDMGMVKCTSMTPHESRAVRCSRLGLQGTPGNRLITGDEVARLGCLLVPTTWTRKERLHRSAAAAAWHLAR